MNLGLQLWGLWLVEASPDIRGVSWWLPTGAWRELAWWTVFTLNLLVLVWALHKMLFRGRAWSLPQTIRDRGQSLQARMRDAEAALQDAQARLTAAETRLANLPAEVEALRAEAETEAAQEYQRLVAASQREADNLAQLGRQEIAAATRQAQRELKALAAALAVDLAADRLRQRLTPELDRALVREASASLASPAGRPLQ